MRKTGSILPLLAGLQEERNKQRNEGRNTERGREGGRKEGRQTKYGWISKIFKILYRLNYLDFYFV